MSDGFDHGTFDRMPEVFPGRNGVTIRSNGKIQSVVKESFDKEYYSEEELQAEIENAVSQYNTNAGAENVEQKGFSVEDQVATWRSTMPREKITRILIM